MHEFALAADQDLARAAERELASATKRETFPTFDAKKDGPLLTASKSLELKTSAGNIHIVLDPSLAPKNATQMYKLFKAGAFADTTIPRFEKDFVLQIALGRSKKSSRRTTAHSSKIFDSHLAPGG